LLSPIIETKYLSRLSQDQESERKSIDRPNSQIVSYSASKNPTDRTIKKMEQKPKPTIYSRNQKYLLKLSETLSNKLQLSTGSQTSEAKGIMNADLNLQLTPHN
jgi:hypothetical protein